MHGDQAHDKSCMALMSPIKGRFCSHLGLFIRNLLVRKEGGNLSKETAVCERERERANVGDVLMLSGKPTTDQFKLLNSLIFCGVCFFSL